MTRSTPSTLPAASEKHLSGYASAALAGIGALSAAQVAEAQIVTTTSAGQTIVNDGTIDLFVGAGFDINGPALHLSSFTSVTSDYFLHFQNTVARSMSLLASRSDANFVENCPKGVPINAETGYFREPGALIGFVAETTNSFESGGNFVGQTGYLGFRFKDPNDPAQTDYGWAEITVNDYQNVLTLDNAAYDESGAPIMTGEVPEPGSLALLAGGAGCLAAWRLRSRRSKAAPADDPGSILAS